jgi:hypothetical protein
VTNTEPGIFGPWPEPYAAVTQMNRWSAAVTIEDGPLTSMTPWIICGTRKRIDRKAAKLLARHIARMKREAKPRRITSTEAAKPAPDVTEHGIP